MAPESLERRIWSSQSDVWAFGVVMWEMWSAARIPYLQYPNDSDVIIRVLAGPSQCCLIYLMILTFFSERKADSSRRCSVFLNHKTVHTLLQ